jgi:uncharacterized protein
MLLVPTEVRPSKIHGIGCFATKAIRKGAVIWEFTPGFDLKYTEKQFDSFPKLLREFLDRYVFEDGKYFVLCVDNARFFNHSTEANTASVGDVTVAKRNIRKGEELTSNYREDW